MTGDTRRWAAPAAAAVAVVVVLFGLSGLSRLGGSAGPAPDQTSLGPRPSPVGGRTAPDEAGGKALRLGSTGVAITGYASRGRTLSLSYTVRVSDCLGRVQVGRLEQSTAAVSLRLVPVVARNSGGRACPSLTLMDSLDVRLDEPLGGRVVRDSARRGVLVPRQG